MSLAMHPLNNRAFLRKSFITMFGALSLGTSIYAEPPVLETTFNNSDNVSLLNGAQIGADGSGVSGKPGDKSYVADLSTLTAGAKGPSAECLGNEIPVQNLDELTVTAWYKSRGGIKSDATLFDAVGTTLIWDSRGFWTLRIGTKPGGDAKWFYWFTTNDTPPLGSWANPGKWTFFAAVWKRAGSKVTFYQGSGSAASVVAVERTRPETVEPLSENPKYVRAIGNRQDSAKDRPFDGNIDDVRFFAKALDADAIEKIRQADLNNEPVDSLSSPEPAPSPTPASTNAPTANAPAAIPAPQSPAVTDAGPQTIKPGAIWPDDRGKHVQAHGGGIIKVGDTYYWFGEDRSQDNPPGIPVVACYSSNDLVHWQFRNQVEKADDPAKLGPGWILERPKVFYNASTNKYVMYAHIDKKGYGYAHVAVFTCDTIDGDYQYLKDFRPLGQESRDIGQFIDDDGAAYLIFECRPKKGFFIAKLSNDYLSVEKQTAFIQEPLEGGALVHYNGLYYVIGSNLTSWAPNPNQYATAASLGGPWSEFKDIAPPEKKTYGSQSTFLLKVVGSKTTSVIFMGDIWKPSSQWNSRYLWMPLDIGDGKLWVPEPKEWTMDVATGEAEIN
jgi:hypothetical protein